MDLCDVASALVKWGVNKVAEKGGLSPFPVGNGVTLDLNPGFMVEQEFSQICTGGDAHLYSLDLTQLTPLTQQYLLDRMEDLHEQVQNKQLGIPGDPYSTPAFGLGLIGLPGTGSITIWRDADKEGIKQLSGVMVRYQFDIP